MPNFKPSRPFEMVRKPAVLGQNGSSVDSLTAAVTYDQIVNASLRSSKMSELPVILHSTLPCSVTLGGEFSESPKTSLGLGHRALAYKVIAWH